MLLSPSCIEELRVPVRRAEVELHTPAGTCRAVVFLAPDVASERILEDEAPFFPAEEGGVVRLFARSAAMLVVADEASPAGPQLTVPYDLRPVVVQLRHGAVVTGAVRTVGRTRMLDVLNQPARSFAVHSGGKVHHVAKAYVEHVTEGR